MNSNERREQILEIIKKSEKPYSATSLANNLNVSRQIIVGDIALLRASGVSIIATPRGYILENNENKEDVYTIAVNHDDAALQEELYTIVDLGGTIIDVIVEHPLYGQLSGLLHISSRYDVDQFLKHVKEDQVKPLSELTNGLHLHTIKCPNEEVFKRILSVLRKKGYLYEKSK